MKNYLFIFTLLLMSGCGGAQKSTKDTMAEILKIAHQDSVLNYKDYQTITTLHEQNQAELIALIQDDSSLLFNYMEIIGKCYKEMYFFYDDTNAIRKCKDLYLWKKHYYTTDTKAYKISCSNLVEVYAYLKQWDDANLQLNENFENAQNPSIDHATCLYTKAWLQNEMGDNKLALSTIQMALSEYQMLYRMGCRAIFQDKGLPEEQLTVFRDGIQECEDGINDCKNKLLEWQ